MDVVIALDDTAQALGINIFLTAILIFLPTQTATISNLSNPIKLLYISYQPIVGARIRISSFHAVTVQL